MTTSSPIRWSDARAEPIFADLFGGRLSEETSQLAREELCEKLQPFEDRLSEILPQQTVLHADETSVAVEKIKHWVHDHCIWAFLENFEIPFTHNEAERAFRFLKTRMKISGCFRTIAGARRRIRIYGYISTVRKNGLNGLECLRNALEGRPFLPKLSKTT